MNDVDRDRPTLGMIRNAMAAARARAELAGLTEPQRREWAAVCDAIARWMVGCPPCYARHRARGLARYRRLEAARGAAEAETLLAVADALDAAAAQPHGDDRR